MPYVKCFFGLGPQFGGRKGAQCAALAEKPQKDRHVQKKNAVGRKFKVPHV